MAEYIDRDDAINAVRLWGMNAISAGRMLEDIRGIPPADVAPVRRGRWIVDGWDAICSNCRDIFCGDWDDLDPIADCDMHYCPNCGARMEEDEK